MREHEMRHNHQNAARRQIFTKANSVGLPIVSAGHAADYIKVVPAPAPRVEATAQIPGAPMRLSEEGVQAIFTLARRMRDLAAR